MGEKLAEQAFREVGILRRRFYKPNLLHLLFFLTDDFIDFIYFSFLTVLRLRCSSCGKWVLPSSRCEGLLAVVAPLVVKHGLWGHRLQQLWGLGSRADAQ